ncbi:hypothetical protein bpmyx0001_52840 [Bacillus pseudomycoides DSM 12442]|nr:hypothetical protein bpmyx0001_52840 [Bacillus pseudomycoides DSM 12442]
MNVIDFDFVLVSHFFLLNIAREEYLTGRELIILSFEVNK